MVKKYGFWLLLLWISFLGASAYADELLKPSTAQEKPLLRFGTLIFYPPYVYNKHSGFEIAIARGICERLNVHCVFEGMPWGDLFTSLNENKIDAIIASTSITETREKEYNFSTAYYRSAEVYLGSDHLGTTVDAKTLRGKKIGVLSGSTTEFYLQQTYGDTIKLMPYTSTADIISDLGDGKIDLTLTDIPMANYWMKGSNCFLKTSGAPFYFSFDLGLGIVLRKEDTALKVAIDQALQSMKADGSYAALIDMYMSQDALQSCAANT